MALRMLRSNINWIPSEKGLLAKADIVELDLDAEILAWLKEAKAQASLTISDADLAKMITKHSPEAFLKSTRLAKTELEL